MVATEIQLYEYFSQYLKAIMENLVGTLISGNFNKQYHLKVLTKEKLSMDKKLDLLQFVNRWVKCLYKSDDVVITLEKIKQIDEDFFCYKFISNIHLTIKLKIAEKIRNVAVNFSISNMRNQTAAS